MRRIIALCTTLLSVSAGLQIAGIGTAAADTPPAAPTVYSADYPDDGYEHGGVGDEGTFRISDSAGVAARYEVSLNGGRLMTVPTVNGEARDVEVTPPRVGTHILEVRAFSASGLNAPPTTVLFRVNEGAVPAARFGLDESAGGTSVSAESKGTVARVRGEAALGQEGRIGSALTLSGGYAESALPVVRTDRDFTVSAWVRPTAAGTYDVLAQDGQHQSGFRLGTDAQGRPAFGLATADTAASAGWRGAVGGAPLPLGSWSLLTGVHDRSSRMLRLYVNGTTAAVAGHITTWRANGAFQIGRGKIDGRYANSWPGGVDDVRTYARALPDADVRNLAQSNGTLPAPTAHWPLDEPRAAGRVYSPASAAITAALGRGTTLGAPGREGTALRLDGSSRSEAVTRGPVIDTSRSFAVAAWVKAATDTTRPEAVLSVDGDRGSGFYLGRRPGDSGPRWSFGMTGADGGGEVFEVSVSNADLVRPQVGEWAHLAAVYDAPSRTLSLYVNGEPTGRVAHQDSGAWRALGPLVIGRAKWNGAPTGHFHGDVDDVRVHDRILTQEEITKLNVDDARVKARWRLNVDGSGEPAGAPALTLHGGATIDPGAGFFWGSSPAGLMLNGTGAYAATTAPPVDSGGSFTIAGWVRVPTLPESKATVFSLPGNNANVFSLHYRPNVSWEAELRGTDDAGAPVRTVTHGNVQSDNWHHLAVVYDARRDRLSLYVDGNPGIGSQATGVRGFTGTGGLQVGRDSFGGENGGSFWPDAIDDIWVYEGVLSEDWIRLLAGPLEMDT